jgi:hypothetical protein
METLWAEREEKWRTAEAEWKALPKAEKIIREEAADAEAAKADVRGSINHWTTLPPKPLNLDSSGTFISKLREIRDGYHTKVKALALFDMVYDDFKNDIRGKSYRLWTECGSTPEGLTLDQLCWIFSRTPTIDKNSEGIINGIRAQIESMTELASDTQAPEAGSKIPDFVLSIAGYYPQFMNHYPELEKAEYIKATGTGLQWQKSKQSLAEYFNAIKPKDKSNNWVILENIFSVSDLRNAASQNGNPFKGKKSKDFDELQKKITIITQL